MPCRSTSLKLECGITYKWEPGSGVWDAPHFWPVSDKKTPFICPLAALSLVISVTILTVTVYFQEWGGYETGRNPGSCGNLVFFW